MNEHIEHFFECLLPTTLCNIECEYCYIIQENRREMKKISLDYSVEHILQALNKKRVGGACFFSICGAGETLIQEETISLVHGLLKEGHYVNITTNGTLKAKFKDLINIDKTLLSHLQISFSFHYKELKNKSMLDLFFENVNLVKNAGCSILIQLNLYDGYLDDISEIKNLCKEKVGAYPQIAVTRKEEMKRARIKKVNLYSDLSIDEYKRKGEEFSSPLFDFTMKNFNVKRKEFCYAGDWTATLNLKTGVLKPCYYSTTEQNIFQDLSKPIKFRAIGKNCRSIYCFNSSHFLSLGAIPSIKTSSYVKLRDRCEANWYNEKMKAVLSQQFIDYKEEYKPIKKVYCTIIERVHNSLVLRISRKIFRKLNTK